MTSHKPDRATFRELARTHPIVPVWREVLADTQTPVGAYLRLERHLEDVFLLESVEGGARWGRYSFLGGDAFATVKAVGGRVSVTGSPPVLPDDGEPPLAYVERLLGACRAPVLEGLPPLHGGAVGFIGYDCIRELERLPAPPPDDLGLPDLALVLTRAFVVFDHLAQKAVAITNVVVGDDPDAAYDDAVARCDTLVEQLAEPLAVPALQIPGTQDVSFAPAVDDDTYAGWVARCKEHIFAGDAFQIVPSRRFKMDLNAPVSDVYRILRTLNPSPYMYLLRFGRSESHPPFAIAGSSPEPLVRVTGDHVVTRPIAGTRRRGASEEEDAAIEAELLADDKERAEHVMLVDLARNDVGRVARFGSVSVDDLMVIERYSHVMHIVSSVTGRLAPGRAAFDALEACFPAGTVTGAPKVRAMEIIASMEATKRGPYAGVVGYVDFSGNLDTCITIRTVVAVDGKAYVQAGAGVVADSVEEMEVAETRNKAAGVLAAVAAANAAQSS